MSSINLNIPAGNGVGTASDASALAITKQIIVSGPFVGVVTIEAQLGTTEWCQIVSFNGPGQKTVRFPATELRVRVSGLTSGTPVVGVSAEPGGTSGIELDVPSADGVGASSDVSSLGDELFGLVAPDGFSGSITIEVSSDNSNFRPAMGTFINSGCKSNVAPASFARVRRAGVTAGGSAPVVSVGGQVSEGSGTGYNETTLYDGTLEVYVDAVNGDDDNGGLAVDDALQTLAAVYRKFPTRAINQASVVINLADDSGAVAEYEVSELLLESGDSQGNFNYRYEGPQMVAFTPAAGPASAVLDAGTPATRVDATGAASGSGLRTELNFTTAAPGWTVDDFATGEVFVRITRGGQRVIFETPVSGNTADTIFVDNEDLVGVVQAGDLVEVVVCGARFTPVAGIFGIQVHGRTRGSNIFSNGGNIKRISFGANVTLMNADVLLDRCGNSDTFAYGAQLWTTNCCFDTIFSVNGFAGNTAGKPPTDDDALQPINTTAGRVSLQGVGATPQLSVGSWGFDNYGATLTGMFRVSIRALSNIGANDELLKVSGMSAFYTNDALILSAPGGVGSLIGVLSGSFIRIPPLASCDFTGSNPHIESVETGTQLDIGTGVGELEEVAGWNGLFHDYPVNPGDQATGNRVTTRNY